ncbi:MULTISPECIES: DUF6249 domain-containing protein [Brevundimonas]|uniref:DUF6249 domain-containing protein n=1 Tax=Brevundimonas TaxID=41275 RepID=UPI000F024252|nr:DUF6249 domain-containing protein [Brevundimonas lutea]
MEILVALAAVTAPFLMVVAIVVWPKIIRAREQAEMQATVRAALEKGQPLPPELIEAMTRNVPEAPPKRPSSRARDIRQGIIWLAVGVGIALFSIVSDFGWNDGWVGANQSLLGIATIPATIGAAFLVLGLLNKNRD